MRNGRSQAFPAYAQALGGCAPIGRERLNRDRDRGSGRAAGTPPRVQGRITVAAYPIIPLTGH